MDIREWLDRFERGWEQKNIDAVLELFTNDVKYHETPFEEISGEEIRNEWRSIRNQKDINIETEVFSETGDGHTVKWSLSYRKNGELNNLKGIYLIKLNSENKCYEFWQYPVEKNN